MRASVAIVLGIVMLLVGINALGLQSQQVKPDMNNSTNLTSDSYNTTNTVYEGLTNTLAKSWTWMGMGAIVLLSLGYLGTVGGTGR